jgi:hypothetical protein
VLTKIDFELLGVKPKGELLRQASKVLSDLPTAGDLEKQVNERNPNPNGEGFPIETVTTLLEYYVKCQELLFRSYGVHTEGWQARQLVWTLMNACLFRRLQGAIKFRNRIEDGAEFSELCAVAIGIIREYETYCLQRSEIDKHVKVQRRVLELKHKEFFVALEERDGSVCRAKGCGSLDKLVIDHFRPLSLGGFSVLENLQLLCGVCNGVKGDRPMDYLYRRMNQSRGWQLNNDAV